MGDLSTAILVSNFLIAVVPWVRSPEATADLPALPRLAADTSFARCREVAFRTVDWLVIVSAAKE